ncbi:MAG: hypothetical protein PVH58_18770, partial [Desulfobacterales bacterium]
MRDFSKIIETLTDSLEATFHFQTYDESYSFDRTRILDHIGESKMQITTLLGSAKKKGNTATVLGWVEEKLK